MTVLLQHPINALDIVPGLLDVDDQITVSELMADNLLSMEEIQVIGRDVITTASGHDWWWTLRLLAVLEDQWAIVFGAVAGPDLESLPLGAFLDRVYYACIKNLTAENRKLFDMDLESVPEGVDVELDEEAEGRAFMKMMSQAQSL